MGKMILNGKEYVGGSLLDTNISNPTDGQVLTYDNATGKWVNTNNSSRHDYSETEHVIGTWIDGKPLYERIVTVSRSGGFPEGEYLVYSNSSTYHLIPNGLMGMLNKSDGTSQYLVPWANCGGSSTNSTSLYKSTNGRIYLNIRNDSYSSYSLEMLMRYTKTTD